MAHGTWKYGLSLGLVGFALASGCVVKSGDGDDNGAAGDAGDTGTGGSNSTGGSSTGGKAGSTSTGGSTTGGSSSTGGSGTTGGSSSTGGSGTGGMDTTPECDPPAGELDNTLYPNCTAEAGNTCEECIESNCCDESMACYGYSPGNVCGWGGPDGFGEIDCYIDCAQAYVMENGVYDDGAVDMCTGMCATDGCGAIGNATQDMVVCLQDSCETECFTP